MVTEHRLEPELRLVHSDDLPRLVQHPGEPEQGSRLELSTDEPADLPLWHVRVTLGGRRVDPEVLHRALEQLCSSGAFLGSARYAPDRVELNYWDEAEDVDDAAALALRVWNDHRRAVGLPAWTVIGLEVLGRDIQRARGRAGDPASLAVGDVRPLHR